MPRDRQSQPPSTVSSPGNEKAEFFSRTLRSLLDRFGWRKGEGYDIKRLSDAAGVRWQTAQFWVQGKLKELPDPENLAALAQAFGVTVDELLGIAMGDEPTNPAWMAFLETEEGRGMTPEERRLVGSRTWGGREPSVFSYHHELLALRATKKLAS